jgi:hypothetical protein
MTVLESLSNLLMTKRIRRHPRTGLVIKSNYANEKLFRVRTIRLGGFAELASCLGRLCRQHHAFVVRGEPLPGTDREKTRRLVHDDPETGDCATFAPTPRHWFAVDIDKVTAPSLTDVAGDPDDAIDYLIGLLPPELRDASCWWQFTTSQGLPGGEDALNARLWFWSRVPLDDAGLVRWAAAANKAAGRKLIDPVLYRPVQPHYVASPIFEGMSDPVPRRCGIRRGLEEEVSLVIPEADLADPYAYGNGGFVGIGVAGYLEQIGGELGFRAPMVAAVASYFASNGADADPEPLKSRLREAFSNAPRGGRSDHDIGRYLGDRHLNDIIGWVRARERSKPRKPFSGLKAIADAVPVGAERTVAVHAIAAALIRCERIPSRLALALVQSWNDQHCAPPLSGAEVCRIVDDLARRETIRLGVK